MAAPLLSSADSPVSGTRPLALSGTTAAETANRMSAANPDYPRPLTSGSLTDRLEDTIETWVQSHYELVTLAAEFADSPEWILTGSPTAAHWLAAIADLEPCTARGRAGLLEYDHVPAYEGTGHTITTELKLRCAPCHHQRHKLDVQ